MKTNKNKGFTLVELLIVIAIIGILSAVVISALGSARKNSKEKSAIAQMNQARNQAEIFYNSHGNYQNLCYDATLSDTDVGMKPFIIKALKALGADVPESYYKPQEISVTSTGTFVQGSFARCHSTNSGYFFNPRWAAQIPLLRTGSDNKQLFYCIDSTGESFETTRDLANPLNADTEYLSCVQED